MGGFIFKRGGERGRETERGGRECRVSFCELLYLDLQCVSSRFFLLLSCACDNIYFNQLLDYVCVGYYCIDNIVLKIFPYHKNGNASRDASKMSHVCWDINWIII